VPSCPIKEVKMLIDYVMIESFPDYTISRDGEITSYRRKNPKIIEGKVSTRGYKTVGLRNTEGVRKHVSVHRLVAVSFMPNPNNLPEVNHIDGNKLNNSIDNLEWCSKSDNAIHAIEVLGNWPNLSPILIRTDDGTDFSFQKRQDGIKFVADREGLSFDHVRKLMSGQRDDVSGLLAGYTFLELGRRCNDYPVRE
jgi:hypothetical protein